jgi:hypothetical protein
VLAIGVEVRSSVEEHHQVAEDFEKTVVVGGRKHLLKCDNVGRAIRRKSDWTFRPSKDEGVSEVRKLISKHLSNRRLKFKNKPKSGQEANKE